MKIERERLIRLICEGMAGRCGIDCSLPQNQYCDKVRATADYLLKNGVIVPPVKVGDTVYALWETLLDLHTCPTVVTEIRIVKRNLKQVPVLMLERMDYSGRVREYRFEDFGKTVFLTQEEAEAALKENPRTEIYIKEVNEL